MKTILCVDCKHCQEGKLVDDAFAMFKCDIYDLYIPAVCECKDYDKEVTDEK